MKKNEEKQVGRAKREELTQKLNGYTLHGEIITWNARSPNDTHKHKDVLAALASASLDQSVARELLPRFAFSRACKKLSDEQVIDVVKEQTDTIKFQFTKKAMNNEEWVYKKDTQLTLHKITGQIECPKQNLKVAAQSMLDEAIDVRTTSDISHIVQKLFEKNGELFPIRDQGGVYFVPKEHTDFIYKIENFLKGLGGDITRFPVPAGSQSGDKAVQKTVKEAIESIIQEHEDAIDLFTVSTRQDTMHNIAEKIKHTRIKIEAYAEYLKDKSSEMLDKIEEANEKLLKKIDQVSEDKINNPQAAQTILGHAITGVLNWMGGQGWVFPEAKRVVEHYQIQVQDSTIRGQLWCGKTGRYTKSAKLSEKEIKTLEKVRKV